MTVKPHQQDSLVRYQVKMLENNRIVNLAPMSITERNGEEELFYEVTSCITLQQMLERRKMEKKEFLNLLGSFISVYKELPEYQLSVSSVLLSEEYIYVRPGDYSIRFIYLPDADEGQTIEPMRHFLSDLVMHGNIAVSAGNFVPALIELLNKPEFNFELLQKFYRDQLQAAGKANRSGASQTPQKNNGTNPKGPGYGVKTPMRAGQNANRNVSRNSSAQGRAVERQKSAGNSKVRNAERLPDRRRRRFPLYPAEH